MLKIANNERCLDEYVNSVERVTTHSFHKVIHFFPIVHLTALYAVKYTV